MTLRRSISIWAMGLGVWMTLAPSSQAEECREWPMIKQPCVTGFRIDGHLTAEKYVLPLGCQLNLTRRINSALTAKGYDIARLGAPIGDYLSGGAVAAIQCEQRRNGLPVTGAIDRNTLKVILGYDLILERCKLADLENNCPLLNGSEP